MEKVVYLLGAGFSAPLGLPVMSNFLSKSKDMYFEDQEKYSYFSKVFDQIRDFSVVKNYYNSDLFNIEEILSILEMSDQLEGRKLKKDFIKYLSDVVTFYTPQLEPYSGPLPSNWDKFIFGIGHLLLDFGYFYAGLHNIRIVSNIPHKIRIFNVDTCFDRMAVYAVITLNYDLVLEKYSEYVSNLFDISLDQLTFISEFNDKIKPFYLKPVLAKLHGSVGLDNIIPPTWSKGVDRKILNAWRMAYRALVGATQIRIIGYSLSEADAYVKYLLKAAVMKAPHLKRLDVLCLDPDGEVRQRYDSFVQFPNYRFENGSVTDYLSSHRKLYKRRREGETDILEINKLEEAHNNFFKKED